MNASSEPVPDGRKRVSMADVAARAGVSSQTVSRVVNESPRVDPETRARVEAAMADLDYRMHRAARALRTGRTGTIGLIASTLTSVGNSRMVQSIADAAASRGFALTIVTASGPDGVADGLARLRDQGIDGAVILNEATAYARSLTIEPGLALVVVDSPADDRFTVVQTEHAAGAAAATRHLIGLGRGPVWHLAGPAGSFAAAERERGWREALAEADLPAPDLLRGDWTAASGHDIAARLSAEAGALFVANDQMALGALRALADSGRVVPDDIAVVGFDDLLEAAQYRPPLTTVRQDFDGLGEAAVAALVDRIEGRPTPAVVREPALVIRASA